MNAVKLVTKRNIDLIKENERLKDEINRISFIKDQEYKKLWKEHQEAIQKLGMINQFTQNLTKVYPCEGAS